MHSTTGWGFQKNYVEQESQSQKVPFMIPFM